MCRYIIIIVLILSSCSEKELKTHYIYWKTNLENKPIVKYKMEVTSDGVADGYCWHYYKNGQLLSKVKYEDNKLMEIYEVYDPLGNQLNYGNLRNGNGYAISYNEKKGIREFAGNYKDGLRNGWWKNYNFRGELEDSIFFEDGISEGQDFYLFLLY